MSRFAQNRLIATIFVVIAVAGAPGLVSAKESSDLVKETRELLEVINQNRAEIAEIKEKLADAQGEQRVLLQRRRASKGEEAFSRFGTLVQNVVSLEQQGVDASEFREAAQDLALMIAPFARSRIEEVQAQISELAGQRASLTGEELVKLESSLAERDETLDALLDAALTNTRHMETLGLDTAEDKAHFSEVISDRAEIFAARIQLSLEQISALESRLKEKPDDAELADELSAAVAKRDRSTTTLKTMIEMMDRLGMETADYQKLMIEATGQITTDILDTKVALGLFGQWLARIKDWLVASGPGLFFKVLVFALILFVFHLLAKFTRRVVARAVKTSKLNFSQLLQKMFVSMAGNAVWIIGILVALSQLGFALGPILAGFGIAGFIIGFALQETLGNLAAGVMILIYRPFDVGDLIEAAGVFGKVSAMSMVSTTVLTLDHQTLIVPNGKIWGDVIKNVTHQEVRRVDMVFGISYTDDIPHTEKVLAQILEENPKVLDDPEPTIRLHTLGESSVDFVVRPWCKTDDYWDVYWAVTREVKMRFDREGISIPFPQRDVHFYEQKRLAPAAPGDGGGSAQ